MKNFIKHLLMLCLFGMISMGAKAYVYSGSCGDKAQWSLDTESGLLSITGSGNMSDYSSFSSVPWYNYRSSIESLSIGDQITSIGNYAFSHCSGLTSVTIGNSVTSIRLRAFEFCTSLTSVTIGNSVTSIEYTAFLSCSGLTSIVVESGNTVYDSRDNCNAIIKTASNKLIIGCKNTTIPNSVTSIGNGAFEVCTDLTSVTIGNSVTVIGEGAFVTCTGLKSVNISNLDKWAKIEFSERSANPLSNAKNLYLNGQLVTNAELTTAEKISSYAFYGCSSLESVTIGNSVTSIGNNAFDHCSGLTSVTIPNSVTSIGGWAFSSCSGLTSVTIGNSVTSIGEHAFYYCSGLKNIIAEGISAPNIGWNCFESVTNCSLYVPLGSEGAYASNFGDWFGESNSYGNTIETYSSYSKNSAGEYSFETWGSSSDVTLSEGIEKVYVPVEATVNKLEYKRTFNNTDWQALYVPFELSVKTDLANFDVYKISTYSADAINVTLMTDGNTSANTPYLIKAKATGEQTIPVSSKTVKVTEENTNSDLTDFEIVGTYAKLKYGDISGDWYALKDGKFMKAGEGAYLNPYRFYLKRKASSSKESIEINFNEPTGITLYENDNDNDNLYNLNGMRVDSNYKGIVIINGKKYLKK